MGDIVQQATQSEDEELQIALQTKNSDALEPYLQKYPETKKRSELQTKIATLKRSELTEWTLYEVGNQHNPQYIQLSSIQLFENRAAARIKMLVDPSQPKVFYGKSFPNAAYIEEVAVYDCAKPATAISEDFIFNDSGKLVYHFKWADPQYLDLSIGVALGPGSVGLSARNIACHMEFAAPLVSKTQLAEMKFTLLSSTPSGDGGEIFFAPIQASQNVQDQKEVVLILHNSFDHNVKEFFPAGISITDPPNFRTEVDHVLLKCNENKFLIDKTEFWSAAKELVRVQAINRELPFAFSEFKQLTPYATLQEIVCGKGYGGIGVVVEPDHGLIRVTAVLSGSPAEKVGVKTDDVITHVNGESVGELTPAQVIEKLRGPAHSKVDLTIMRKGEDRALEVAVNREIIERHLTQGAPAK
jgi:hypothetical protein